MRGTCWHLGGGVSRAQHPSKCRPALPSTPHPGLGALRTPPHVIGGEAEPGTDPRGTGQSPAPARTAEDGSELLPFRASNSGGESKPSVPAFTGAATGPRSPSLWGRPDQWACLRTRAALTPGGGAPPGGRGCCGA